MLAQALTDWEALIIDDGSGDGTWEVVSPYLEDARIRYWRLGREFGEFVGTGVVSCEWVSHPAQRHKIMQEPVGGINPLWRHYRVHLPLR